MLLIPSLGINATSLCLNISYQGQNCRITTTNYNETNKQIRQTNKQTNKQIETNKQSNKETSQNE